MANTIEININNLRNHPNNVRKTYSGIPELAVSIKENGILQNLTVVPDPENEDMYLVVIGNRRLQAVKKAGLTTVPCIIAEMEETDQALTMLTENMQRKDLTLIEESAGFQMCLEDYGIKIDTLAEKTGFSKTTVRHRLNVAKLDRDILKDKMDNPALQISITDLAMLEKVKSIEKRNEILDEADDSRDIAWMVEQAVLEEKRERTTKKLVSMAKKESIAEAPEDVISHQYSYNWEALRIISLDNDLPDHLLNESDLEKFPEEIYYIVQSSTFKVIGKRVPKEEPQDTTASASSDEDIAENTDSLQDNAEETDDSKDTPEIPAGPSEYELREQDRKARHQEYDELYRDIYAEMDNFVRHLIDKKIDAPEDIERYTENCWCTLRDIGLFVSRKSLAGMLLHKASYSITDEELDGFTGRIENMPAYTQMLAVICQHFDGCELMDYAAYYLPEKGSPLHDFHDLLDELGFSFSDDAFYGLMAGTHAVYLTAGDTSSENDADLSDEEDFDDTAEADSCISFSDGGDSEDTAEIEHHQTAVEASEYSEAA